MRQFSFFLSAIFIGFFSCKQTDIKYAKSYFDFDSLVNRQVRELAAGNARWKKVSSLNEKTDTAIVQLDTAKWKNELDIFRQLDAINRGIFKGYYKVSEQKDIHSNLTVRSYRFQKSQDDKLESPVPFVDFYFFNQFSDLRKIVSVYEESNLLFSSSRKLSMEFEEGQKKNLIGYQVNGFQKMILADSVLMNLNGSRSN
jgi:hypothetical protein